MSRYYEYYVPSDDLEFGSSSHNDLSDCPFCDGIAWQMNSQYAYHCQDCGEEWDSRDLE